MKESRLKWRSSLKCVQPTNWNSLDILPHSRRRALRRGGSRWTTGGWCTSKILWWAPKQRPAEQAWLVGPDGVCLCVQDAYARGEVFIGSKENGYTAVPGLPPNIQGSHWQFGITIVTPERKFLFACETEPSQKDWMAAFQTVINRPMLPQEYAGEPKFHFNCSPSHTYQSDLFFGTFSLQWRRISNTNHDCAEYAGLTVGRVTFGAFVIKAHIVPRQTNQGWSNASAEICATRYKSLEFCAVLWFYKRHID